MSRQKYTAIFNVVQPKPKADNENAKQFWNTIGVAFKYEGDTPCIRIHLDALPMPDRDIILFERTDTDNSEQAGGKDAQKRGGRSR